MEIVCVKDCPKGSSSEDGSDFCKTNQYHSSCVWTKDTGYGTSIEFRYPTKKIIGKYCFPDTSAEGYESLNDAIKSSMTKYKDFLWEKNNGDTWSKYVTDVITCWWALLASVGVAFGLGFVYMLIVFCCAKILVWIIILGLMSVLIAITALSFFYSNNYETNTNEYKYLRYGSYVMMGVTGVYAVIVICCIP